MTAKQLRPIVSRGMVVCDAYWSAQDEDIVSVCLPTWDQTKGGGWVMLTKRHRAKLRRRAAAWLRSVADQWEQLAEQEEQR